ncbi:MazG nucleotide pyrophosphohydrolase domain-containing protein [Arcobacter arenosus]|uniref:NTP pyrophosphohydrolase MazG-like domain-containing protein n=1 Tax=Arcobacter arenosus TaxID=2576037 RepID=A0A5R8Y5Y0_9BACT|nr:MazG nucleotide pyrophosphohydrolase domain-containing protein [Arcobacter arenosus]TLP41073.1 hypothetical protein FDK22_03365 [Arcobacter arenosus]
MNREQHYLLKLSEECSEVAKECSKAILFGLDDFEPNQTLSNQEKIENELADLLSVMNELVNMGKLDKSKIFQASKRIKKAIKVDKYFQISCELGRTENK